MGVAVKDPNFMTSLARGLTVIQAFSQQRRTLSISQISQRTGISRAAARRCIHTLGQLGFVGSEDGRQFRLRPRILLLGHAYLGSMPLGKAAQPVLRQMSDKLNECASIAILDGDQILYVARASAARFMVINLDIGSRLPANCTSLGRVMLSHLSDEDIEAHIDRTKLVKYTPKTIITSASLREELLKVRAQGYSVVDQELELGLRTIAVPIFDSSRRAVAAMSVGTHVARVSVDEMTDRFLPSLLNSASELSIK